MVRKISSIEIAIFEFLAFFEQIAKFLVCLIARFNQGFAGIREIVRNTFLIEVGDNFQQYIYIRATKSTLVLLKTPTSKLKSVPRF